MTWVKLDENFSNHPKILAAGPLAGWLHVCGLCYCNKYLTDGFLPYAVIPTLANFRGLSIETGGIKNMATFHDDADAEALADTLVRTGVWDEVDGGYNVHDYLEYNPSKAQVEEERRKKQAAGQAGGQASATARAQAKSKQVVNGISTKPQAKSNPDTDTDTVLPPKPPKGGSRETRISDDFAIDDDLGRWALAKGFTQPEIDHHTEAFVAYWRGEGGVKSKKIDWRQAWQTWLLREKPGRWPGAPAPIRGSPPSTKPSLPPMLERGKVTKESVYGDWFEQGGH